MFHLHPHRIINQLYKTRLRKSRGTVATTTTTFQEKQSTPRSCQLRGKRNKIRTQTIRQLVYYIVN